MLNAIALRFVFGQKSGESQTVDQTETGGGILLPGKSVSRRIMNGGIKLSSEIKDFDWFVAGTPRNKSGARRRTGEQMPGYKINLEQSKRLFRLPRNRPTVCRWLKRRQ